MDLRQLQASSDMGISDDIQYVRGGNQLHQVKDRPKLISQLRGLLKRHMTPEKLSTLGLMNSDVPYKARQEAQWLRRSISNTNIDPHEFKAAIPLGENLESVKKQSIDTDDSKAEHVLDSNAIYDKQRLLKYMTKSEQSTYGESEPGHKQHSVSEHQEPVPADRARIARLLVTLSTYSVIKRGELMIDTDKRCMMSESIDFLQNILKNYVKQTICSYGSL